MDEAHKKNPKVHPPYTPSLKVGLFQNTVPQVHPAAMVPKGGEGPNEKDLSQFLLPVNPPSGCAHLLNAWRNYLWHQSLTVKRRYTQERTDKRFKYFCRNLKRHQIQSWGKPRLTTRAKDGTITTIAPEKLQWNKYFDMKDLSHLRGFFYATRFASSVSHRRFRKRHSGMRTDVTLNHFSPVAPLQWWGPNLKKGDGSEQAKENQEKPEVPYMWISDPNQIEALEGKKSKPVTKWEEGVNKKN